MIPSNVSYFAGFTKITSNPITLHKPIPDENIRLIYGDSRKLLIIDSDDIPEQNRNNVFLNIYNVPKTEYVEKKLSFNYYYGSHYIYPYLNELSIESMKDEPIKFIERTNYFINRHSRKEILFVKVEKLKDRYFISYYIKDKIIETCKYEFNNSLSISRSSYLLIQLLIAQKWTDLVKQNDDILANIQNFDYNEQFNINEGFGPSSLLKPERGLHLYNYQKQDILWMKSIENNVDNGCNIIEYDYSQEYKVPNVSDDYYLHDNILSSYQTIYEKTQRIFKYYGGNIISEVGLGKTIVTLYYILQNDKELQLQNDKFVKFGDACNYFYKRGKAKGNCCTKPKHMNFHYCKQHVKTPFMDKRQLLPQNLEDFDFRKYIFYTKDQSIGGIKTNASLIICKNQLCDQWVQEYYDKFQNNHRVLLVVTYDQYSNLTLSDLLFSDIVIISYEFLTNKRYLKNIEKSSTNLLSMYLNSYDKKDNSRLLDTKIFNCFSLFYWNRIVYDEAHEISSTLLEKCNLSSKYKWNITGTPFVDKSSSFLKLMSYNTDYTFTEDFDKRQGTNNLFNYNLTNMSTNNLINMGFNDGNIINKCKFLFRRNTKDNIEYDKNIINEFTNLLEFTSQERSIYDGYVSGAKGNYINFLIKLCCHPELNEDTREMIKNCKTFDEIHNCLLNYNKSQIETEEIRIKNIELDIKSYENEIKEESYEESYEESVKLKINLLKRKLTTSKKNYESISRTYNYLKTRLENLQTSEACPICLETTCIQDIAITKCGHKFCWDCLYQTHKSKESTSTIIKCPSCNTLISNKEVYLLKENEPTPSNAEGNELSSIIQTVKSTKIGNIIHFLKQILYDNNNKVILFSQWDELLHKVGNILTNQNIKLVYCNGSVYQRKRAINLFYKDPDTNLILLSSKNSASGINLTVANKIIFLEPIYGNQEYRKNVECQAIGRADRLGQTRPIDIHRFIIKDTIEQDIYNNCIDDGKIKGLL